jgi:hypothetical protein
VAAVDPARVTICGRDQRGRHGAGAVDPDNVRGGTLGRSRPVTRDLLAAIMGGP